MSRTGAEITGKDCRFTVWAPGKQSMTLHIISPQEQMIRMQKAEEGYFSAAVPGIDGACKYFYRPDDEEDYPDPSSHFQPEGVHGPSQVVDHEIFKWNDDSWRGVPFNELVFYEIHVGTFTPEGTFEAIIPLLGYISSTGINAIELMPVCQFPGNRNWGYDGVFPYSVQNSYGGPEGLKKLVDACHSSGLMVFLDVVYNHVGPEGNYFSKFGPYFSGKYKVPWGDSVNLDDSWSDGVREFFSCNPCHWHLNYHIDGLRLDAIHMIYDSGAVNFWTLTQKKIEQVKQKSGRNFYLIAESDLNSPSVVKPVDCGGYGFNAQWLDDFHHALYVMLHREGKSSYEDFGQIEQLAKAYKDGFVHSGQFVKFRRRLHGSSSAGIPGNKFVAFNQNHDQIGNRVNGERLSALVDVERQKIASAALFLSPYLPLLFMGEEYGEDNPFFYFVSHTDEVLIRAVREGRKKEFEGYKWQEEPPDPQDEKTFNSSKINREKRLSGKYRLMLEWNKKLISLRRTHPALKNMDREGIFIYVNHDPGLIINRKNENELRQLLCFFNFSGEYLVFYVPSHFQKWYKIIDSQEVAWDEKKNKTVKGVLSDAEIRGGHNLKIPGRSIVVYDSAQSKI
jgi:maltooligosyltrehalose trehalohydrolase